LQILFSPGKSGDSSRGDRTRQIPTLRELREIQRRACIIHQRHGSWSGGYSLDDWLEAEHELDEEHRLPRKERIH